jgi:hypothetical protein
VRNEGEVWERRRRAGAEVVETKVEDRLICIEVVLLILVGMEILVVDTLEKREKPGVIRIVVRVVLGVDGDGRYGVVRRSALIRWVRSRCRERDRGVGGGVSRRRRFGSGFVGEGIDDVASVDRTGKGLGEVDSGGCTDGDDRRVEKRCVWRRWHVDFVGAFEWLASLEFGFVERLRSQICLQWGLNGEGKWVGERMSGCGERSLWVLKLGRLNGVMDQRRRRRLWWLWRSGRDDGQVLGDHEAADEALGLLDLALEVVDLFLDGSVLGEVSDLQFLHYVIDDVLAVGGEDRIVVVELGLEVESFVPVDSLEMVALSLVEFEWGCDIIEFVEEVLMRGEIGGVGGGRSGRSGCGWFVVSEVGLECLMNRRLRVVSLARSRKLLGLVRRWREVLLGEVVTRVLVRRRIWRSRHLRWELMGWDMPMCGGVRRGWVHRVGMRWIRWRRNMLLMVCSRRYWWVFDRYLHGGRRTGRSTRVEHLFWHVVAAVGVDDINLYFSLVAFRRLLWGWKVGS